MIMAVNPFNILRNAANDLLSAANSLEGTSRTQNAGQEAQPQRPQLRQGDVNHCMNQPPVETTHGHERVPATAGSRPVGQSIGQRQQSSTVSEFHRLFNYQIPWSSRVSDSKHGNGRKRKRTQSDRKKKLWTHKFVCLSNRNSGMAPTMTEKCVLSEAGLGEKDVGFDSDGDSANVYERLLQVFPTLQDAGGFEILRTAERSSTMLVAVPVPRVDGYTVAYLKSVLNQAKGYIRPVQRDIETEVLKLNEVQ